MISSDSRTLHVGPIDEVTPHIASGQAQARSVQRVAPIVLSTVELYDEEGRPWRGVARAGAFELEPDGTRKAAPAYLLLDRIDAALAHLQVVLDLHPELGEPGEAGELTRVPRPTGDLGKVLEELKNAFAPLHSPGTRGNWLHMLAHAAGVAH
jgi:hypothetical protein